MTNILPIVPNRKVKETLNLGPFAVRVKLTGLLKGSMAERRMSPLPQSAVNPESEIDLFVQAAVENVLEKDLVAPVGVIVQT